MHCLQNKNFSKNRFQVMMSLNIHGKMSMRSLFLLFLLISPFVHAEIEDELSLSDELLFVSLGSNCEPAHQLRCCDLRKTAFPFDWIISFDGEAVINMLENDFRGFLSDEYFVPYGPAGHLLQTIYHLEFLHEGDFNSDYEQKLEALKEKYHRRVERFKSLRNYLGKVIFLRYAFKYSLTDPHRFYKFEDNIEISEEYALRLYQSLSKFFPQLDFDLIILNNGEQEFFEEQKQIDAHIKIFRVPNIEDLQMKIDSYKIFFNQLIQGESYAS